MTNLSKIGAIAFGLWGALHIVGAAVILAAVLGGGAAAGYALYGYDGVELPAVTGGLLGYFAYLIGLFGIGVTYVAIRFSWSNSETGLAVNTALTVAVDVGLILFLMLPGYVSLADAMPGFVLLILGVIMGGIACRMESAHGK